MTSRLRLLISYFSQMSSFDDPFCTNGTFRGKLAIHFTHFFIDKATKVIHTHFKIIINGVTNL